MAKFKRNNGKKMEEKVIILDDNELSLACFAEEYPENWEKICEGLE